MIDSSAPFPNLGAKSDLVPSSGDLAAACYTPWIYMEFRDLFGDGSSEGNFQRRGCLHDASIDGLCPNAGSLERTNCQHSTSVRRLVPVAATAERLPRTRIRAILEAGDEICLEFPIGNSPSTAILTETAHLLRKLRNTGISITVSGLSTADKSRLSRLEWPSN